MFSSRLRRAGRGRFGGWLRVELLEGRVTPTTFVVSNLLDGVVSKGGDLPGSLRQAIFDANANPGADVVDATGVSGTIVLAAGELKVTKDVDILGSGSSKLIIDAQGLSRCLSIAYSGAPSAFTTKLSGFTVTGGKVVGNGGGISIGGGVTFSMSNMVVAKNEATGQGGGVSSYGTKTIITDSEISENKCMPASTFGGGGLYVWGSVSLTNCIISDNIMTAERGGGGISCRVGPLNLVNCELTNNRAGTGIGYKASGGAVYLTGATMVAEQCLFAKNLSTNWGGAIDASGHSRVRLTNCTLVANQSPIGGAIYGSVVREVTLKNCTISGNTASESGGGLDLPEVYLNAVNIENCTITANKSNKGGGINIRGGPGLQLRSTIVADNLGPSSSPDISSTMPITAIDCNIGEITGIARLDRLGTFIVGSPLLGELADNGGFTPTHLPLPNSPVRGMGSNAIQLSFDQRGEPRQIGAFVDIGAVESYEPSPTARVIVEDVVLQNVSAVNFDVTFADPDGMSVSTIFNNMKALRVTGPNGFDAPVEFVSVDNLTDGPIRTASYRFFAPNVAFTSADNGVYEIVVQPNQIMDVTGVSLPSNYRFAMRVHIPWTFVVDNTLDGPVTKAGDLPGSLRQAIFDANEATTEDVITFSSSVFTTQQTIKLTAGPLTVADSVNLIGPGQDLLTIDADGNGRAFYVSGLYEFQKSVSISGMSITNGFVSYGGGGGIYAFNAQLTLVSCAIFANQCYDGYSTYVGGGGVYVNSRMAKIIDCQFYENKSNQFGGGLRIDASDIVIQNSEFDGNTSSNGGGGVYLSGLSIDFAGNRIVNNQSSSGSGGGLYVRGATTLSIHESVISGNTTLSGGGGGVYVYKAKSFVVLETLISGNTALSTGSGGGLFFRNFGTSYGPGDTSQATIIRSQIVDNSTNGSGGGLFLGTYKDVSIEESTIDGNVAGRSGGGAYFVNRYGFIIERSTISNNIAEGASTSYGLGGGAIQFRGLLAESNPVIRQTTISGNTSKTNGGAIVLVYAVGTLDIESSTIVQNTAIVSGGGIALQSGTMALKLTSTIIANNHHATTPDVSTSGTVTADHSLIGVTDGITTLTATASLTGTLAAPLDPLLAPLADNGGPTKTHVPLPGSPAINRGSNPLNLTYDQRGAGFPRQAGIAPDIGAFEFPLPPVVNAFVIGDGTAQRSMVRSVTVSFSEAVTFPFGLASAFQLQRTGPGGPTGLVNLVFQQVGNVVTLTFDDPVFAPGSGKSLVDGNYSLTLIASKIQGVYASLDGNGNGIPGDNSMTMFYRLFGDSNGDRQVSAVDYNAFRMALATNSSVFDFDNDGVVGAADFLQFRLRYGTILPGP